MHAIRAKTEWVVWIDVIAGRLDCRRSATSLLRTSFHPTVRCRTAVLLGVTALAMAARWQKGVSYLLQG
jgi:hypothetical protein